MDSEAFARFLGGRKDAGQPVTFVVGGPHGLDAGVLKAASRRVSLSAMTLPHELATLVLMEQIFRAYAACAGKAYAK
jgi:23S rRNA (pseudouridine1915-N3)-methyltransferase